MCKQTTSPDSAGELAATISVHDLRHHLALLACDLSLTRERLERGEAPLAALYPPLLARLERGLTQADHMLAGRPVHIAGGVGEADRLPLVKELWERFRRAGRLRRGSSELRAAGPLLIPGDAALLHSLLLNLLENACRAAPQGPIVIEADGGRLAVENGGQPLDPELAAALNRGQAAPPAGERGHGLGLILKAASALGLQLTVESEAGRTRFVLERSAPGAPRLLLVEDDRDLCAMLAELLRQSGWRVEQRPGGEDLEPSAGAYDAVVADLNLPGLAGDHLLAAWKQCDPATYTLLLTGESEAAERDWPGVDTVVIKPGLQRLLAALASARERIR